MKAGGGHHWTTHGLADPAVFAGLGIIFTRVRALEKTDARRVIGILAGAVAVSAPGLVVWFVIYQGG
jgi:hypothetical protein